MLRARVCSTTPTSCAAASARLSSVWRELGSSSSEGSFLTRARMRLSARSETPVMLDSTRTDLFMPNERACKRVHKTLSKMATSKPMRASPMRMRSSPRGADAVYRKVVVTASNEKTKGRLSPPPTNYRKAVVTASNEQLRSGCHRRQPTTEQRSSPPPTNN